MLTLNPGWAAAGFLLLVMVCGIMCVDAVLEAISSHRPLRDVYIGLIYFIATLICTLLTGFFIGITVYGR